MKNRNEIEKAGKIRTLDLFIVVCILLLAVSAIGQDIAVYAINQKNSSQKYEMTFVLRSVSKSGAEELAALQEESEEGLEMVSNKKLLGRVTGELVAVDPEVQFTDVTGVLRFEGHTKEDTVYLYDFGAVREGDTVLVSLNGHAYSMSVTGITETTDKKI